MVNFSTIARDCGVSSPTITSYFEILEDTRIGTWLPPFRSRPKRRIIGAPKFYWFDVGIVNYLAKRGRVVPGSELFGKAFENWVFHELWAYVHYRAQGTALSYWRLASGIEVDFIVGNMSAAIEAKASSTVTADHLRGLEHLLRDHPEVEQRLVVSLEPKSRRLQNGIRVLSAKAFVASLWDGELF